MLEQRHFGWYEKRYIYLLRLYNNEASETGENFQYIISVLLVLLLLLLLAFGLNLILGNLYSNLRVALLSIINMALAWVITSKYGAKIEAKRNRAHEYKAKINRFLEDTKKEAEDSNSNARLFLDKLEKTKISALESSYLDFLLDDESIKKESPE